MEGYQSAARCINAPRVAFEFHQLHHGLGQSLQNGVRLCEVPGSLGHLGPAPHLRNFSFALPCRCPAFKGIDTDTPLPPVRDQRTEEEMPVPVIPGEEHLPAACHRGSIPGTASVAMTPACGRQLVPFCHAGDVSKVRRDPDGKHVVDLKLHALEADFRRQRCCSQGAKIIGSMRAASTTIGHVAETSTVTAGRDRSPYQGFLRMQLCTALQMASKDRQASNDPQVCATSGSSARPSMVAARLLKLSAEQKLTSGLG